MVKIELTDGMLWRVINQMHQMPITDTAGGRVVILKRYLHQVWAASISYDDVNPVTGRRYLEFADSKRAVEFALKYG